MPKRYSITDASSNLATLVDEAEAGEPVGLTRRGKPVAAIMSLRELERRRGARTQFSEAYRRFLASHSPSEWDSTL